MSREVHQDFAKIESGLRFPQIRLGDDGPPFLHVFVKFRGFNEVETTVNFLNSPEVQEAQECQRSIQNLLDASIYEPSHYDKLRWLAIYWNTTVAAETGRALRDRGARALDLDGAPAAWAQGAASEQHAAPK
jgi:hypothetical protein